MANKIPVLFRSIAGTPQSPLMDANPWYGSTKLGCLPPPTKIQKTEKLKTLGVGQRKVPKMALVNGNMDSNCGAFLVFEV